MGRYIVFTGFGFNQLNLREFYPYGKLITSIPCFKIVEILHDDGFGWSYVEYIEKGESPEDNVKHYGYCCNKYLFGIPKLSKTRKYKWYM